jgi:sigma-B regulation protein RsbU (phosphoserine phosphatase)
MSGESKKVILLVDDTPANIQIALAILKDLYQVRVATNGAKALELAAADPAPDLILLDVMMPGIDGFEVCTRLKASPATHDIPVIFLTGQTEIEDETRGFEVGGVDYIHKPFSPAVVKARVHTHLVLRGIRERLAHQLAAMKSELETARQIQLSILPREMPKVAGLDIAARYIPMTEVAGDFYDFIVVDEKRVGAFVGDVSGHGMPAALISSMLKIALAAQAPVASDPAKVMAGLNLALCGKFQGHFVTAAYIFMDLEKGVIRYAGAGHPPLVLGGETTGSARGVEENGLMLGAFSFASYTSVEFPFHEGMWALLYTDGILEMSGAAGEEFGIDRLTQFTEKHEDLSACSFVEELFQHLSKWDDRHSGPDREDDLTVLAIKFQGTDGN